MKQSIVLFIQTPKAETIIHESDIDSFFTKIYSTIMTKIKKKNIRQKAWVGLLIKR